MHPKRLRWFDVLFKIEFWIFLYFLVGMTSISLPPLDAHSWRQTLTLMVAKNFHEINANIFYPRLDIGNNDGVMATEFPIFNYLMALFYKVFCVNDWSGRFINWFVSLLSAFYFYKLLRLSNSEKMSFYSTLFYLASVTFIYARKTMPDSFSLSLVIIGTYYAYVYLKESRSKHLILSFVLISLGVLSKIPSIVFLSLLSVPLFDPKIQLRSKIWFVSSMVVMMSMVIFWYFFWMPHLEATYGNKLIWPVSLADGFQIFKNNFEMVFQRFYYVAFSSKIPFYLFSIGVLVMFVKNDFKKYLVVLLYTAVFILFIFKTGSVFHTHVYYVIPFTPLMSLAIGYLLDQINVNRWGLLAVAAIVVSISISAHFKDWKTFYNKHYLGLEKIVDAHIGESERIMVNGGLLNPSLMYFAKRRGVTVKNDVVFKKEWMPDYKREDGVEYIVIDRQRLNDPLPYKLLFEDENFRIYKP